MRRTFGRHARTSARGLAVAAAVGLMSGGAHGEDKKACATAYVQAQVQRQKGHLKAARDQLLVCSRECSATLQSDCATWLREVEAALPSIVIEAIGPDGKETAEVRVTCDGVELLDRLDGRAIPMDPGPHACRAEMAGEPPQEQQLLVPEGEQHRPWRVSFKHRGASSGTPRPPDHDRGTPASSTLASIPDTVWALGIGGVVATLVGVGFEVSGLSQHGALNRCKPSCTPSAVSSDKTAFAIGDVTLGLGLVSLGAAAVLYFTRPAAAPEATAGGAWLTIDARRDGGGVGLRGSF